MLKNKKSKLVMGACALMAGTMIAPGSIMAAESTGTTPVSFDNSTIVDVEGNGRWGVAIPTAINFTSTSKNVTSEIELVGMNGTNLDTAFSKVEVTGTVKSANGFTLTNAGATTPATYEMMVDGTLLTRDANVQNIGKIGFDTNASAPTDKRKMEVKANLLSEGSGKGQYLDNLTFTFTGTSTNK